MPKEHKKVYWQDMTAQKNRLLAGTGSVYCKAGGITQ